MSLKHILLSFSVLIFPPLYLFLPMKWFRCTLFFLYKCQELQYHVNVKLIMKNATFDSNQVENITAVFEGKMVQPVNNINKPLQIKQTDRLQKQDIYGHLLSFSIVVYFLFFEKREKGNSSAFHLHTNFLMNPCLTFRCFIGLCSLPRLTWQKLGQLQYDA